MTIPLRYTREDVLTASRGCGAALFDISPDLTDDGTAIETTAERLAERSPHALLWLAGKRLIPLDIWQAGELIERINPGGRRFAQLTVRGEQKRTRDVARVAARAQATPPTRSPGGRADNA